MLVCYNFVIICLVDNAEYFGNFINLPLLNSVLFFIKNAMYYDWPQQHFNIITI